MAGCYAKGFVSEHSLLAASRVLSITNVDEEFLTLRLDNSHGR